MLLQGFPGSNQKKIKNQCFNNDLIYFTNYESDWLLSKILKNLSDCNGIRTHNHLVHKQTLNHLAKLANYGVWIQSKTCT